MCLFMREWLLVFERGGGVGPTHSRVSGNLLGVNRSVCRG